MKVYRDNYAEIAFHLVPVQGHTGAGDRIVGSEPGVGGFINSAVRVRQRLNGKDSKYELHGAPYAIVLGVQDDMCSLDDILEGLIGSSAVLIATGESIQKGDGFFGLKRRGARDGKHTRVSSLFALEDWWPGGPYNPRVTRFDNPFAAAAFPVDGIPFDAHWGEVERNEKHVRADWLVWPQQRVLI